MLCSTLLTVALAAFVTADSGACKYSGSVIRSWEITVDSAQNSGVCKGITDNLGPHCAISSDNCNQDGTVKTLRFKFNTEITCPAERVQDSIWIATEPHLGGVTCLTT